MRAWDEFVAAVLDVVPPGTLLLLLLAGAALTGALWYSFPAWVPRRLPRWRLPRLRLPRRRKRVRAKEAAPEPVETPPEPQTAEEPVAAGGVSHADRLAAEGRYAEAIRQRLRETLRELVAARLVPPQPGWTAAELAAMAAAQRPAVARPLGHATELFSEIWYGDRPAGHAHDEHMRALTDQVRAAL
jgi:Domain of unknown function (DUF4129)